MLILYASARIVDYVYRHRARIRVYSKHGEWRRHGIRLTGGRSSYGFWGVLARFKARCKDKKYQEEISELEQFKNARYKHIYLTTAIAVRPDKKKIFLVNGSKIKYYKLSDVREWRYELHKNSGLVSGSGLMSHMDSISSSIKNGESSGLFIKIKDVDHPEWYIRFESEEIKGSVVKWMEILDQVVNV